MAMATTSRTRKKGDCEDEKNLCWTSRDDLAGGRGYVASADLASENATPEARGAKLSQRYANDARRQEGQVLRRSAQRQDRHHQLHVHQVSGHVSRHDCEPREG